MGPGLAPVFPGLGLGRSDFSEDFVLSAFAAGLAAGFGPGLGAALESDVLARAGDSTFSWDFTCVDSVSTSAGSAGLGAADLVLFVARAFATLVLAAELATFFFAAFTLGAAVSTSSASLAKCSRIFRATGASIVEDALLTNSPESFSACSTIFEVVPSSFANS